MRIAGPVPVALALAARSPNGGLYAYLGPRERNYAGRVMVPNKSRLADSVSHVPNPWRRSRINETKCRRGTSSKKKGGRTEVRPLPVRLMQNLVNVSDQKLYLASTPHVRGGPR
mgnify:CR=1 FL=1